ncbi:hypothetical protein [Tautonia sociabilis]|uniref:Uncharacterized protein n=1 Tax=Tautonia sociabilis TaxID=2080755 RepID=A0A432MPN3_9BACT|nr:hypothetical protein [Tautonia sociabilis]RUL89421.1 hypothetical protein TsocGM_01225 [Tautonia sociabilis]
MPDKLYWSDEEIRALNGEWEADEHAARVRDYGEADAATYPARMAESYRLRAEALGPAPPPQTPVGPEELDRIVDDLVRQWRETTPSGSILERTTARSAARPKGPEEGRDR